MNHVFIRTPHTGYLVLVLALQACGGCLSPSLGGRTYTQAGPTCPIPVHETAPRELSKAILPPYCIEPPDVLQIEAIQIIPRSPYHLRALDSLVIQAPNALEEAPISGVFPIEPGGLVNLGYLYGSVKVAGLTVDEARDRIEEELKKSLRDPQVAVSLADIGGKQQISGPHLVSQDGTVTLGSYGTVLVVGLTLQEAKEAIERHLDRFLENPEVSVDVLAFNSKNFYVVTQGAELGDGVLRFPITGNETVLDAISQVNGMTSVSSTKIWIARPGHGPCGNDQILPVDWIGLTQRADTLTNYQLLPGDRVYIAEDKLVAFDNILAKMFAPANRVFGVTLLGAQTVFQLQGRGFGFQGF